MAEISSVQMEFRAAMANLPAAVIVITTEGAFGRCGMTVTAVCSVTDSPPTVLVCINRSSAMHDVFLRNGRIAINALAGNDEKLASHFAGVTKVPMDERFHWDIWEDAKIGVPVLRNAHVALVGRISDYTEVGSHSVIFVELEQISTRTHGDSLVYYQRKFHRLSDPVESPEWPLYDEWSDPSTVTPVPSQTTMVS
ncbi:flavin reductase [Nocardia sp. NPDC050793]|uniref:flavin reductase n=1 Tax=Nocardia sp. NPDC050793 TaxID=3155159 RepID=UPI0033F27DF2